MGRLRNMCSAVSKEALAKITPFHPWLIEQSIQMQITLLLWTTITCCQSTMNPSRHGNNHSSCCEICSSIKSIHVMHKYRINYLLSLYYEWVWTIISSKLCTYRIESLKLNKPTDPVEILYKHITRNWRNFSLMNPRIPIKNIAYIRTRVFLRIQHVKWFKRLE